MTKVITQSEKREELEARSQNSLGRGHRAKGIGLKFRIADFRLLILVMLIKLIKLIKQ